MTLVACINCKAQLNIVSEMEAFECGHCGLPLQVVRDQDSVTLKRQGRTLPTPAHFETRLQVTLQEDPVLVRLRSEVESAFTVSASAAKAEEGKGFGWVIGATVISAFVVGWWAILVFVVAGVVWATKMEKRKKIIIGAHAPRIAQKQQALDAYIASTSRSRPVSTPLEGNPVPFTSAVKQPVAGSASGIGRTIAAAATGAFVGSALASAGHGSSLQHAGDQPVDALTPGPMDAALVESFSATEPAADVVALQTNKAKEAGSRELQTEDAERLDSSNDASDEADEDGVDFGDELI